MSRFECVLECLPDLPESGADHICAYPQRAHQQIRLYAMSTTQAIDVPGR